MESIWPIFIPSKGRPNGATQRLLQAEGIRPMLVVEAQDVIAYAPTMEQCSMYILPEINQGIGYARAAILSYARLFDDLGWFWMFDDDITGFFMQYLREDGARRMRPTSATDALLAAQELISTAPASVAAARLDFRHVAWHNTRAVSFNSHAFTCFALNSNRTEPCQYRTDLAVFEDIEFSLQVRRAGKAIAKLGHIACTTSVSATAPGGCTPLYADEDEAHQRLTASAVWIAETYGREVIKPYMKSDGRWGIQLRTNWRQLPIPADCQQYVASHTL